jgi:general secretion pathway protein D
VKKGQRAWKDAGFDKKALEKAYTHYIDAMDLLPLNSSTESQRNEALDDFCKLSIEYANHLIDRGQFNDAQSVAKTVLSAKYNPNYKPAAQLLANLEQPSYYNRTITPAFADKKDKITVILNQAEGYLNTGRYDLAAKSYEDALNLDTDNKTARMGLENIKELHNYSNDLM